jgi:hypothetical protein
MENLKDFKAFVLEQTNYKGVHFVMADGVIFISICSKTKTGFQIFNQKKRDFQLKATRISKRYCPSNYIYVNLHALCPF